MQPLSVALESDDYSKAILALVEMNAKIKEKEPNVYIKATLGSMLKVRMMGLALCKKKDLPTEIIINFPAKKIEVHDASGPGIKTGVNGRIEENMSEIAYELKKRIENVVA